MEAGTYEGPRWQIRSGFCCNRRGGRSTHIIPGMGRRYIFSSPCEPIKEVYLCWAADTSSAHLVNRTDESARRHLVRTDHKNFTSYSCVSTRKRGTVFVVLRRIYSKSTSCVMVVHEWVTHINCPMVLTTSVLKIFRAIEYQTTSTASSFPGIC